MSNELSNFDIIDIIKDLKLDHCFGGVYSKDQLPKDLMRTKFYLLLNKFLIFINNYLGKSPCQNNHIIRLAYSQLRRRENRKV